jgi:hypothetical protein
VVKYIGAETRQPDWLLVSDEMYVVAFVGQCLSQISGKDSTSSECRVTNDPYVHGSNGIVHAKVLH